METSAEVQAWLECDFILSSFAKGSAKAKVANENEQNFSKTGQTKKTLQVKITLWVELPLDLFLVLVIFLLMILFMSLSWCSSNRQWYRIQIAELQRRDAKLEAMRKDNQKLEMVECTFSPRLNATKKKRRVCVKS